MNPACVSTAGSLAVTSIEPWLILVGGARFETAALPAQPAASGAGQAQSATRAAPQRPASSSGPRNGYR